MAQTSVTQGAHHIGLTVPDLDAAKTFFTDLLGFDLVHEVPEYPAAFVSDGTLMITLWRTADPESCTPFDRKSVVGLHHLALKVDGKGLDEIYSRIKDAAGVEIEFAPEPLRDGPTRHMMCTIPGGIRMEFIAPEG
jgi:catechol 2,3-dioxygenase-like lactoylglutathione lyase family enzyme